MNLPSEPTSDSLTRSEKTQDGPESETTAIDGLRRPENWKSFYADYPIAVKQIRREAIYLIALLFLIPILMMLFWIGRIGDWLHVPQQYRLGMSNYALSWLGGTLGGTLFAMKWLYHSVAKHEWYSDRQYWRYLTPHLSGALSFAIITLISSGLLKIFDQSALHDPSTMVGLGFLCGYFSDSAIAKMTEVADTLFGTLNSKNKNQKQK